MAELEDTRTFMNTVIQHIANGEILKESQLTSQLFTCFIFVGIFTFIFSNIYSSYGTYTSIFFNMGHTIVLFSRLV